MNLYRIMHSCYECGHCWLFWFYTYKYRDKNGLDMDRYHRYHICFYISGRIQIRIMSIMLDKIRLDLNIRIPIWNRMLNIWTRIRINLNLSKRIRS